MRAAEITVRIETLVVEGLSVPAHDGDRIAAAVRTELARVLSRDTPVPQAWAGEPAGAQRVIPAATDDPGRLGGAIAVAVHHHIQGSLVAPSVARGTRP